MSRFFMVQCVEPKPLVLNPLFLFDHIPN